MKVVNIIKNILLGIFLVAFLTFAIAMTILMLNINDYGQTEFSNSTLIIIREAVSAEPYKKGDLVVVEKRTIDNIEVGEELFIYRTNREGQVNIDIGIVGEVHHEDNAVSFENGSTYAMRFVVGRADKVHEGLGTYLGLIQSRWGFLFLVLVPGYLIFVYQLYALIIEVKYGKNEE